MSRPQIASGELVSNVVLDMVKNRFETQLRAFLEANAKPLFDEFVKEFTSDTKLQADIAYRADELGMELTVQLTDNRT